jgi:alpha-amylase/alpha-mannosidase (GH57 family)
MTQHHICIHGHFYQPPRENPWLEEIEIQDSAHPYHDWNERITAECYARNAAARILDDQGRIVRITNNYARMSFNFGPTLLSWMEAHSPSVYAAVLEADRHSRERFSGHGSAMAQAYNHMIMPLANTADRTTQIRWGIRDFEHRFGRRPEGMWLPEAGVDLESLAIMAAHGIAFTVLSPYQAARVRRMDEDEWHDVADGSIDPRRSYLQRLPDGAQITLFFYDGPISRDIAFGGLLNDGAGFAGRLKEGFDGNSPDAQLVHMATDGETFGHHHRFGDMALAYALETIEADETTRLTNYAEFLAQYPPAWEVDIKENTAWSCSHGVERWKSNCGCNSGQHADWHQEWRAPLREALDWLRDTLAAGWEKQAGRLLTDPWEARNGYIEVILERTPESVERFLTRHRRKALSAADRTRALKLLEMQRQAMLMYTSCGWFFDELSGIETVQVIQYAGRAVQLAAELFDEHIEGAFVEKLARARSNIPKHRDGGHIYAKWVKPSRVDLKKAAAHYVISSFFEDYPETVSIFCYKLENLENRSDEAGRAKVAVGKARITSQITFETALFHYAVLHMGDHSISCGIHRLEKPVYARMAREMLGIFQKADFPGLFQSIGTHFHDDLYSLTSLFRDEQRKVLDTILEATTADALTVYRQLYDNHVSLMRFINDSSSRIPKSLAVAGEIVVNHDLKVEFGRAQLDYDAIQALIEEAERAGIALESDTLEFTLRRNLERMADMLADDPADIHLLQELTRGVEMASELPFVVRFQQIQNIHYQLSREIYPTYRRSADKGGVSGRQWVETFRRLAKILKIRIE